LQRVRTVARREERAEAKLTGRESKTGERIMLRTSLAALFVSLFITGAAAAAPPANTPDATTKLSDAFSALNAVNQWAIDVSKMADTKAKSDLVKNYAHTIATSDSTADTRLQSVAQKGGLTVSPLNPQTEEGASILDRMKGETALLESLQGDAFDKEYMTLVTNTQQSVLNVLDKSKAAATNPEVKQFLVDQTTAVQGRLRTAQTILAKVYGQSL
jgi:predicted outer membrane protein